MRAVSALFPWGVSLGINKFHLFIRHASKSIRQKVECRLPNREAPRRSLRDLQEEPTS